MAKVTLRFTDASGTDLSGEGAALALQRVGPTIGALVGLDSGHEREQGAPAPPVFKEVEALIDTGASVNCIDERLAIDLRLPIVGQRVASGIGGSGSVPLYLAQIHVPLLQLNQFGRIAGVKLAEGGQRHAVLLGRDFLRQFRMTYDGRSGLIIIENESPPLASDSYPAS